MKDSDRRLVRREAAVELAPARPGATNSRFGSDGITRGGELIRTRRAAINADTALRDDNPRSAVNATHMSTITTAGALGFGGKDGIGSGQSSATRTSSAEQRSLAIRHLNQIALARRWGMSERTLERWRWQKKGPRYLKLGGHVVYRIEDVEAFEAANAREVNS